MRGSCGLQLSEKPTLKRVLYSRRRLRHRRTLPRTVPRRPLATVAAKMTTMTTARLCSLFAAPGVAATTAAAWLREDRLAGGG